MTKFWTNTTEKLVIAIAMGLSGYSILASQFDKLPALPAMVSASIIGGISLLTVAAGFTLYGIYVLYEKY